MGLPVSKGCSCVITPFVTIGNAHRATKLADSPSFFRPKKQDEAAEPLILLAFPIWFYYYTSVVDSYLSFHLAVDDLEVKMGFGHFAAFYAGSLHLMDDGEDGSTEFQIVQPAVTVREECPYIAFHLSKKSSLTFRSP